MAKYTVKTRTDVVRENIALTNNAYGGWLAVNSGVDAVIVNGITLLPGEVSADDTQIGLGDIYDFDSENQQSDSETKSSPWWLLPLTYILSNLS